MPLTNDEAGWLLPPKINTFENRQALIATGDNARSVVNGLAAIGRENSVLLTQWSFEALIAAGANARSVGYGLAVIGRENPALLTRENIEALIVAGDNARSVGNGLAAIGRENPALVTQESFEALIAAGANARRVGNGFALIGRENPALLTQENLEALIAADANAEIQAREIIRRGTPGREQEVLPVADRQSTHLTSVHKSASDSATRLMTSYGNQIEGDNLEKTLDEIKAWAQSLPDDKNSVKECVVRLTAPGFTHEDPSSHVSMHQLLALSWKGLHDNGRRQGDLDNGLELFAQGLDEIQNEYGPGSPACSGGTFNKVIEKLVGIHLDAEQIVITPQQGTAKLQAVTKEEAYKYLYGLAEPSTKEELKSFTDLIAKIKEDGTGVIWDNIKDAVATRLIDEFGSIYNNSKDDTRFQGLLANGEYVALDKLDRFQEQIAQSKGYNEFMKSVVRPSVLPAEQPPNEPGSEPSGPRPTGRK